ncbi:MAG: hypothetical protein ACR2N2_09675 [Acidimicrobiia bacterium]
MGQRIEIDGTVVVDDSIIVSTNRSLTGTDGEGYDSPEQASDGETFAADLAVDLFEADPELSRVFVSSNVVVVKRAAGWPQDAVDASSSVIEEFFLFYPEA